MAQYSVDIVAKALGGAQVDNLAKSFREVDKAAATAQSKVNGATNNIRGFGSAAGAAKGNVGGLGAAIAGILGPIATATAALALLQKGLSTAFERGAAEQKLKNFTSGTEEYSAALALAANSSSKFGISQTQATTALADVYSRLKGLGFGLKETGQIYQGFNAIALQSGTSAEDAAGAFLQLSQALGSGKLQGDELRAILERMPNLAQAIAQSMGVSSAEIRKMGEEGKITSEVIYNALSKAAQASGDFGGKLNAQQQAMKSLGQVSDELLNKLGQVFGPLVIKGVEAMVWAGQKLNEWYGYLAANVLPKVYEALKPAITEFQKIWTAIPWETLLGYLQGALIQALNGVVLALRIIGPLVGGILKVWQALANNPVFKFIAEQVQRLAGFLGISSTKVSEFTAKQKEAQAATAATVDKFSSMPDKVENTKLQAKELKAEQDRITKAIQESTAAQDAFAAAQSAQLEGTIQVAQARLQAEQAINDVLLQQAERKLQSAQSDDERAVAAQEIYGLTVKQAALELQSTQAAIAGAVRKAQLAVEMAAIKEREVASEVALAQAKGIATAEHFKALEAQRQALGLAEIHLQTTIQMAKEQTRAADAIYKGKVAAADAQLQTNLTAQAATSAANAAGQFAQNMNVAASAANNAADALNRTISQGSGTGGDKTAAFFSQFGAAGGNSWFQQQVKAALDGLHAFRENTSYVKREYASIMNGFHNLAQQYNAASGAAAAASSKNDFMSTVKQGSRPNRYATGGYVTGPQMALIGEGGEPEYVIPASKMGAAMSNYAAGARGGAVLSGAQVNIKTGPVTQMAGTDYVTKQDLISATSSAVNQTLSLLKSDPSTRRAIGVTR